MQGVQQLYRMPMQVTLGPVMPMARVETARE